MIRFLRVLKTYVVRRGEKNSTVFTFLELKREMDGVIVIATKTKILTLNVPLRRNLSKRSQTTFFMTVKYCIQLNKNDDKENLN